jgi:hypothetical protein
MNKKSLSEASVKSNNTLKCFNKAIFLPKYVQTVVPTVVHVEKIPVLAKISLITCICHSTDLKCLSSSETYVHP